MSRSDRLIAALDTGELSLGPGAVLYLGARAGPVVERLADLPLVCIQGNRCEHDRLVAMGAYVVEAPEGRFATAMVDLPRSRRAAEAAVASAWTHTQTSGTIVIDGAKTDGIDRMRKTLASFADLSGSYAKSHGRVLWLTRREDTPPQIDRWTAAGRTTRNADGYFTAPLSFSADGIDPGSRALADRFNAKISGRVADFGAGWGYLSERALSASDAIERIDLIEAERASLDAAARNISDPRARFRWEDVTAFSDPDHYDWIVMNPPFHRSRASDLELGRAFIRAAARNLKRSGTLLLVANRHLAYERDVAEQFKTHRIDNADGGFKIITASRPTS